MDDAVAFIAANPGATMRVVIAHVLSTFDERKRERALTDSALSAKMYKQAAGVVERIIKDRHVCQASDLTLRPWNVKRKAYAEALERAMFAAPEPAERYVVAQLACRAWRVAGDENRARTLYLLDEAPPLSQSGPPSQTSSSGRS